jgi:hypothetical protein
VVESWCLSETAQPVLVCAAFPCNCLAGSELAARPVVQASVEPGQQHTWQICGAHGCCGMAVCVVCLNILARCCQHGAHMGSCNPALQGKAG